MFVWVNMGEQTNVVEMASAAAAQGIMLAPGHLFRPHQEPSQWMRFNVAACNDPTIFEFLEGALAASSSYHERK